MDQAATDSALADLELPIALQTLLFSIYGAGEAARRAALAPWPELDFHSAAEERALFADRARLDNP